MPRSATLREDRPAARRDVTAVKDFTVLTEPEVSDHRALVLDI